MKKVVLITGAGKGIGKETALSFARAGFVIAACSRTSADLVKLKKEVEKADSQAVISTCDISKESQVKKFVEKASKLTGKIDAVVNNAAVASIGSIFDTDLKTWQDTIDTNLTGAFLITKHALKYMKKGSHIFNIGSNASKIGFPNWSAYCASKFGLLGFTNSIREELRGKGMKVSAILPGPTKTPLWGTLGKKKWDKSKMMEPASVAEMILHVYNQPADVQTEEVYIIPSSGGL
ncbi:MAG: SDR family oxidoreductase [Candidatus Dadabacteria bacterium]|nr:SDR family oxidoreductase [Candidatus Dadabacteria bacterium]NIS09240.1 SDR family oxidoreductase [Candidatus Dadabacteria bacterium]NIV41888.1 SDR family NAD(P)-dependent oxidoreductase [Candidatus Dadabacteria bacterium]NIX15786.1 SDR family NAD(P)-dependent oxidoreductase [Candidatus Dadabacteria bacterium]NIY22516.1 SDR family NAD(P)-dependent oxidoreductase [Candidatus Dadabacteria bacterium]